jgi:hypothetical protein
MPRKHCLMFLFILSALSLTACNLPVTQLAAAGEPALAFSPDSMSVQAGETFAITLQAQEVDGLTAFEAHLEFNPAVLEVVSLENGGFVAADFVVQDAFDNQAGTLDYAVAQLERPAAQGSGALLVIQFRALAAGTSALRFRATPAAPQGAILANASGEAIAALLGEVSITVR